MSIIWLLSVVLILIAIAVVASCLSGQFPGNKRKHPSFFKFTAHFDGEHIPMIVLYAVFRHLKSWKDGSMRYAAISPDDNLYREYGMKDEDLDEMILELLHRTRRMPPDLSMLDFSRPITTVRDMVHFIAACDTYAQVLDDELQPSMN